MSSKPARDLVSKSKVDVIQGQTIPKVVLFHNALNMCIRTPTKTNPMKTRRKAVDCRVSLEYTMWASIKLMDPQKKVCKSKLGESNGAQRLWHPEKKKKEVLRFTVPACAFYLKEGTWIGKSFLFWDLRSLIWVNYIVMDKCWK